MAFEFRVRDRTAAGESVGTVYLRMYIHLPGAPPVPAGSDMGAPPKFVDMTGAAAPPLRLRDLAGVEHSLADYRDKVVVLDFWAIWCVPCVSEMPIFEKLHREAAGRNVVILAVDVNEDQEKIADFVRRNHYTLPVLRTERGDAAAYHITAFPTLAIVSQGRIVTYQIGALSEEDLRATIGQAGGSLSAAVRAAPLPAPALVSPRDGASFYHYPRKTLLTWAAVRGAVSY